MMMVTGLALLWVEAAAAAAPLSTDEQVIAFLADVLSGVSLVPSVLMSSAVYPRYSLTIRHPEHGALDPTGALPNDIPLLLQVSGAQHTELTLNTEGLSVTPSPGEELAVEVQPFAPPGAYAIRVNDAASGEQIACWLIHIEWEECTIPPVLFPFDSVEPADPGLLHEAARCLRSAGVENVLVYGHTDAVGPEPYNQRLSAHRAGVVADFLAHGGIQAQALALGEQALMTGADDRPHAPSRRADITAASTASTPACRPNGAGLACYETLTWPSTAPPPATAPSHQSCEVAPGGVSVSQRP